MGGWRRGGGTGDHVSNYTCHSIFSLGFVFTLRGQYNGQFVDKIWIATCLVVS